MNAYKFELDEQQVKEVQEWMDAINKVFGEYGLYEYRFTPHGIGTTVIVYSEIAKKELNLSHEENW